MEFLTVLKLVSEGVKGISDASLQIELGQKIIDLQSAALEIISEKGELLTKNQNLLTEIDDLKKKINTLEEQLETKESLNFNNSMYWLKDDENPYCPNCYDNNGKLIHLIEDLGFMRYRCNTCKNQYRTDEQRMCFSKKVNSEKSLW